MVSQLTPGYHSHKPLDAVSNDPCGDIDHLGGVGRMAETESTSEDFLVIEGPKVFKVACRF